MEIFVLVGDFFCGTKDLWESFSYLATVIALSIGAYWTYSIFIKNRGLFPRAEVSHICSVVKLEPLKNLIHVEVVVRNTGDVILPLSEVETTIFQVKPVPHKMDIHEESVSCEAEFDWLVVGGGKKSIKTIPGDSEIEPGEVQALNFEFILDSCIEVIKIYTYVPNDKKSSQDIGWDKTSICNTSEKIRETFDYE